MGGVSGRPCVTFLLGQCGISATDILEQAELGICPQEPHKILFQLYQIVNENLNLIQD